MSNRIDPVFCSIDRLLRRWLCIGLLAVLLIPAARGHNLWIGWMPYWLVIAPALSLALLHRRPLAAAAARLRRARSVRAPRRQATRERSRPLRQLLQVALRGY